MTRIALAFWGLLVLLGGLWVLADPGALAAAGIFPLRAGMVQATGVLAMGCFSAAMVLALRPGWPERPLGGLDKMYRLHKWFGIGGLVLAVLHWLWVEAPKWAVGLGWLERPQRGARGTAAGPVEQALGSLRGAAEGLGEWAFYAAVALIVLALVRWVPYRLFRRTHRWLAAAYLVLVFHTLVLTRFGYWSSPLGLVQGLLLAAGTWAAVVALLGRIGIRRRVPGRIVDLRYYPEIRVLEGRVAVSDAWPGHRAGQFAFVTSDRAEGAHPYTIASAWDPADPHLTFIAKELGDHTGRLRERLVAGQPVTVEGPYGCFTFDDGRPRQIWVGAGIGITPFIARMKQRAAMAADDPERARPVDLFHPTADHSAAAIARLTADAAAAGVRLHVLVDARDGRLNGDRIRTAVPDWREAGIWFCGPAGFGRALRADFARNGLPVRTRFHQELFDLR
ncbi:ferric reductase-like transmembrane domain-containing protein [Stella sp.]|uniref:ferredoxin reductase family protein n=1 Tax=Stella sp. TaxID=2912054 RepID=UPI0035B10A53